MHIRCEPPILYFGTPVALVSTSNENGSANLAPMSSVFWLGWRAVIGLDASSQTTRNLLREGQCVLNLPHEGMAAAVDRLARTTGSPVVPPHKRQRGYEHVSDKWAAAGLTPTPGEVVRAPRVLECPVQLEARLEQARSLSENDPVLQGHLQVMELRVVRAHLHPSILVPGRTDRVDPLRWRPLIMSFQRYFGLGNGEAAPGRLAAIAEDLYRSPDLLRARSEPAA